MLPPNKLSFIAWARTPGRATEIAESLGGEARCFFPLATLPRSVPSTLLRYAASSVQTIAYLLRRRPDALMVQNPPVVPALLALAYCRVRRAPFLLDSHPVAFGAKDRGLYARMVRLHKWIALRSNGVTVASEPFAEVVEAWGGRGIVVHEAPTSWPSVERVANLRPTAFFVCIFSSDEPYEAVVDAARLMPDVDVVITGDTARARADVVNNAPGNVRFTGFLDQAEYRSQLQQADVVLSLTTEKTSVMRSAYEAVYAQRPLVVTDWPNLRTVFPHALFAHNESESIASAVVGALTMEAADLETALSLQTERWNQQLAAMQSALSSR
jgi:glycosyltransferase involved in cell wall biosynthesis